MLASKDFRKGVRGIADLSATYAEICMATSTIKRERIGVTRTSTVSFRDAAGESLDTPYGAAALMDLQIATNPTSHFGKVENLSAGGSYGVMTSGGSASYYSSILWVYAYTKIFKFDYNNGTYRYSEFNIG